MLGCQHGVPVSHGDTALQVKNPFKGTRLGEKLSTTCSEKTSATRSSLRAPGPHTGCAGCPHLMVQLGGRLEAEGRVPSSGLPEESTSSDTCYWT